MLREVVSDKMSSAPWNSGAIIDAFQERLLLCDHSPGQDSPRFRAKLQVEDGKLTWRVTKPEPPDLYSISVFEITSRDGDECHKVFEAALNDILESPEFELLKMAWQTVRNLRPYVLDELQRIERSDEIYRRCSWCRHP